MLTSGKYFIIFYRLSVCRAFYLHVMFYGSVRTQTQTQGLRCREIDADLGRDFSLASRVLHPQYGRK